LNVINAILSTSEAIPTLDNIASGGRLNLDAALNFITTIEVDTACLMTVGIHPELPSNVLNIKAYPNPFHDGLTLEIELEQAENAELMIFDLMGRLVFQQKLTFAFYTNQFYWNGKNKQGAKVADGLYFAHLKVGNEVIEIRLLKM